MHGDFLDIISAGRRRWHGPMFIEIFMLAAWNIWKERNNLVFNAIVAGFESWKTRFLADLKLLVFRTKPELHTFISSFAASI
jgi:hypothetical protein